MAVHGGTRADWLDLSTGINARPWPAARTAAAMPDSIWQALPDHQMLVDLLQAARTAYGLHPDNHIVAAPGTQALIQLLPRLAAGHTVAVRHPSYNEHRGVFADAGWTVLEQGQQTKDWFDATVVVNPNNPDGLTRTPADALKHARKTGTLIVDEAFVDVAPTSSLCPHRLPDNVLVLRSFGKFFGLAGLRLGFAVGSAAPIARLSAMLGPWAVSGPAQYLGARALADTAWIKAMKQTLTQDCASLRKVLQDNGLTDLMGTDLFQTAHTPEATAIHERLARAHIWTRIFDTWPDHIRFGVPGSAEDFTRLHTALQTGKG